MFLFRKTTTHTHIQRTPLPSPPTPPHLPHPHTNTFASALALLHNASFIITRSPLVKAHRLLSFSAPPASATSSTVEDDGGGDGDGDKDDGRDKAGGNMILDGSYTYEITDQIPLLPLHLWDSPVIFTAVFTPRAQGLDTFVRAPMGTRIRAEYRIISSSTTPAAASDSGRGDGATDTDTDTDEEMEVETGRDEGKESEASFILIETAVVDCHWALYPLIIPTMAASHADLHAAFVARLREILASSSEASSSQHHLGN